MAGKPVLDSAAVADVVRAWIHGEGTLRELARRSGISASTLSRYAAKAGVPRKKAKGRCVGCGSPEHTRRNCPWRDMADAAEARATGAHEEARADG
jgi:hypothetical protein